MRAAAEKESAIRAAKIVAPVLTRPIALAMSRHGELTLACRTVMAVAREIVKAGGDGLRR